MSGDEEDIAWEVCAEEEGGLGMGLMLRQIEVGEGILETNRPASAVSA